MLPEHVADGGEVCRAGGSCPCARPRKRESGGVGSDRGAEGRAQQVSAQSAATMDRLLASPHTLLRKVALSPEALACGLVSFGTATATTRNSACTMHQIGSYDLPTACGGALVPPSAWIVLRMRPALLGAAVIAHEDDAAGSLPSLYVYSRSGRLVHRVLVHSGEDAGLLAGLGRSHGLSEAQLRNVQLMPLEERCWRDGDQLAQLDAVFDDGGRDRHATLVQAAVARPLGASGAGGVDDVVGGGLGGGVSCRVVDTALIAPVFEHLSSVGLPVCVGVPSSAVLQLSAGMVHLVERVGALLVVSFGAGVVEVDLAAVRSCLLVTAWGPHGRTSTLELYDESSRCVAVLTQLGLVGVDVHRAWEHMLESLPAA